MMFFILHVFVAEESERLFHLLDLFLSFAEQAALCLHVGRGTCQQHLGKESRVFLQLVLPAADLLPALFDLLQSDFYRDVCHGP